MVVSHSGGLHSKMDLKNYVQDATIDAWESEHNLRSLEMEGEKQLDA